MPGLQRQEVAESFEPEVPVDLGSELADAHGPPGA
jgi:hypothetical protein